jgi:hypothetical protein
MAQRLLLRSKVWAEQRQAGKARAYTQHEQRTLPPPPQLLPAPLFNHSASSW